MLRLIDLRESSADPRSVVPRAAMDLTDAGDAIRPVLEDVRVRGADAVLDACERFDSVRPDQLRVPASVVADALAGLDPSVRRALEVSIERARRVHQDQRRVDVETEVVPGGTVTERWLPVSRVGLYVPGGRA
ncbi:MAG: histidinol dehydrogenase, partial [Actinomycetota bacterium]|nr:histidinol dehydrogenase [Actinomycetota bacterium]